jgi:Ricin-type beta-trefoil lectin domain/Cellulase (glycosyl hydrolase family 5)
VLTPVRAVAWGAVGALTIGLGLAGVPAPARGDAAARPMPAGYAPIKTGQGMCLNVPGDRARDGQPVQLWQCLGGAGQAWQAQPDGTIRNANGYCLGTGTAANGYAATANGSSVVMVSCSQASKGSFWTINAHARQIVNRYAEAALDNAGGVQRDGRPVRIWSGAAPAGAQDWAAVPAGGGSPVVRPGRPPALHIDGTNMVTSAGQVFVPRGFTLSTLQYTTPYLDKAHAYATVLSEVEAQINAIAGAWHGNIVRLQVEQDDLVQRISAGDRSYLDLIRQAVGYAKEKGLVVVLNAQTEPSDTRVTSNEPLPTQQTARFWQILQPYYGNDASVIIDQFNEPRPLAGTTVERYMRLWKYGGSYQGVSYLGEQQLARTLRAEGYQANMLWVETPGNEALEVLTLPVTEPRAPSEPKAPSEPRAPSNARTPAPTLAQQRAITAVDNEAARRAVADPAAYLLNGIANVSYSFHHPTVLGTPRTPANWDAQFGNLVRDDELSVNDGEWVTRSQYVGSTDANGDSGPCWIDAPAAVPSYLSYLQQLGVGMAVWTLSDGAPGFGITAASDPGTFTTTATMDQWPGCVNVNPTRGPGALIMAWFKKAG